MRDVVTAHAAATFVHKLIRGIVCPCHPVSAGFQHRRSAGAVIVPGCEQRNCRPRRFDVDDGVIREALSCTYSWPSPPLARILTVRCGRQCRSANVVVRAPWGFPTLRMISPIGVINRRRQGPPSVGVDQAAALADAIKHVRDALVGGVLYGCSRPVEKAGRTRPCSGRWRRPATCGYR